MKHYGLIGYPLTHSFSKKYFEGVLEYDHYECPSPADFIDKMPSDICGFNVTIPHKQSIIPLLDNLSTEAQKIGAVNCVKVHNGKLTGYNTDAYGFELSLLSLIGKQRPQALVFGNGGATKAILYTLDKLAIRYNIVSRSSSLNYDTLSDELLSSSHLLINCTPVGTHPNKSDILPINTSLITARHYVFDLIYNPSETTLLRHSRHRGAWCKNGLEMLHLQAQKSLEIWQTPTT